MTGIETMHTSPSEGQRNSKIAAGVMLGLSVAIALILTIYIGFNVEQLQEFIVSIGILGPLVSVALQTLLGASPIPTEPLTVINGAVFGPWQGTFYSWLGYMFASYIEYWIGMHLNKIADFEEKRHKLPLGLGRFPADSPWFLMFARIIPGYGPKMVGLMGGVYRVNLWRFTWTGAIPSFIGAAVFAFGGHGLMSLF